MSRDRGGPPLAHQILIYPMIDDREITVSSKFEGVLWDRATTGPDGRRSSARTVEGRTSARMPPQREPRTSVDYHPPTSRRAPRKCSGTKSSTTQPGWPKPAYRWSFTRGKGAPMASSFSRRTPRSHARPSQPEPAMYDELCDAPRRRSRPRSTSAAALAMRACHGSPAFSTPPVTGGRCVARSH